MPVVKAEEEEEELVDPQKVLRVSNNHYIILSGSVIIELILSKINCNLYVRVCMCVSSKMIENHKYFDLVFSFNMYIYFPWLGIF